MRPRLWVPIYFIVSVLNTSCHDWSCALTTYRFKWNEQCAAFNNAAHKHLGLQLRIGWRLVLQKGCFVYWATLLQPWWETILSNHDWERNYAIPLLISAQRKLITVGYGNIPSRFFFLATIQAWCHINVYRLLASCPCRCSILAPVSLFIVRYFSSSLSSHIFNVCSTLHVEFFQFWYGRPLDLNPRGFAPSNEDCFVLCLLRQKAYFQLVKICRLRIVKGMFYWNLKS